MSDEAGNLHTGPEIGRTLQLAREKRGLSLEQVEEATKIRAKYLRDLENENFDVLPSVYVLGSLKTYAEYLGLDGVAITTELKRRQASLLAEQDQEREDPSSSGPLGLLASLGRLLGIGETAEEESGRMPDTVHSSRLHVSLVVVLVFVLATVLVSSLGGEGSVSQVREPKISQIPSGNVGGAQPSADDLVLVNHPEQQTDIPVRDAGDDGKVRAGGSGLVKGAPRAAQASSSSPTAFASAPASAPASASASASATSTASTTASPQPASVRPEPATKEQPGGGSEVAAAPAAQPASASGPPVLHKTQVVPIDASKLGNRIYKLASQQGGEDRGARLVISQETSPDSSTQERQLRRH
ncbi:MAG: helix-turn-helix domain-containing protein [Actinomycetota bacterium]|nr:helix-turn-helix domain-containing protein [Actinomycetota bacterium]